MEADRRSEAVQQGSFVSHFQVEERLGSGGMGIVYRARDVELDRTVALKFLPPELSRDEKASQRFVREARAASSLDHPNICTIHEVGRTKDDQLFIAMALYEGESLQDKLKRGPLSLEDIENFAAQIARGLGQAHEKGIVHRDIKPANVFVTTRNEVKILDFGLARLAGESMLTTAGSIMGTASYMSPEQARGDAVDFRSDIWSFGVVLYEMLTGERPFRGAYGPAVVYSILNGDPVPVSELRPDTPTSLQTTVDRCLRKDPGDRPGQIDEVLAWLAGAAPSTGTASSSGVSSSAGAATQRAAERTDTSFSEDPKPRMRRLLFPGGIVLGAVLAVLAIAKLLGGSGPAKLNSIAVLPLENLTGDEAQEYLVDGMTEAIITSLGRLSDLRVTSRTSVMHYKNAPPALRQIADELKVAAFVEGSVSRSGDRIQVTAKLIRAADDTQIWGETFQRSLGDLLSLQNLFAKSIAEEIDVKLTSLEQAELASERQVDPQVQEDYLKAKYFLDNEDLDQALEWYRRAMGLDSTYAPVFSGLAEYYRILPFYRDVAPAEAYVKAGDLAKRAVALDPNLADAYGTLAFVRTYQDWDWEGAEPLFRRALSLNPSAASVRNDFSRYLASQGRFEEARSELEEARRVNPIDPGVLVNAGLTSFFQRDYDRAIRELDETLALNPDFPVALWGLGLAYQQKKMYPEAIENLEKASSLMGGSSNSVASLGNVYAQAGMLDKARESLSALMEMRQTRYTSSYMIALVLTGLGETDEALDWLERAYDERSTVLGYAGADPRMDPLRDQPRFVALVEKMHWPKASRPTSAG